MRIAVLAVSLCLSAGSLTIAAGADAAARKTIAIPAQDLGSALQALAKERELHLVFVSEDVRALRTDGVSGNLTTNEALSGLLSGTGLTYQYLDNATVSILPAADSTARPRAEVPAASSGFRLAQAEGSSSVQATGTSGDKQLSASQEDVASTKGIPEILVKGSRGEFSLNADIERSRNEIQPYVVLDREAIQRSAAANIADLLKTQLTMNYAPDIGNNVQTNPIAGLGNRSTIALRGLSAAQTLILIDGRRAVSGSFMGGEIQPDLNAIPLNAIERIEILPTGAAAIYGGSALGGVVNVILRRDYTGLETGLFYESAQRGDGQTRRIDVSGGTAFFGGKTRVLLNASYSDSTPVLTGDREFFREYRQRTIEQSMEESPQYLPTGATPNIVSRSGEPLVLKSGTALNSTFTSVPAGYAGIASDNGAALVQNAGRYNDEIPETAQIAGAARDFAGAPVVKSMDLTLRHEVTPQMSVFGEIGLSRNSSYINWMNTNNRVNFGTQHPGNPFLQSIGVNFPVYTSRTANLNVTDNKRVLAGVDGKMGRDWHFAVDYSVGRYELIRDSLAGTSFLDSFIGDARSGAFDLFRDDREVRQIQSYLLPSDIIFPTHSTQQDASVRFAGPLIRAPGGPVMLSFVTEFRTTENPQSGRLQSDFDGSYYETQFSSQSADAYSAYLEATIPLISEQNGLRAANALDLQLAGRYDKYRQVGGYYLDQPPLRAINRWNSSNPMLGLKFKPMPGFTVRASYSTGFLPPDLLNLYPTPPNTSEGFGVLDPKRGNEIIDTLQVVVGGNPDLVPEESISRGLGIIVEPNWIPSLRVSFDWTKIAKKNNITSIGFSQESVDREDFLPGIIIRGQPTDPNDTRTCTPGGVCPIIGFDSRSVNNARAQTESYDISFDYSVSTAALGEFKLSMTGTRLLRVLSQLNSLSPYEDTAGLSFAPTWSAFGSVEWSRGGAMGLLWSTRYFDSYWIRSDHAFDPNFNSDTIGSIVVHDFAGKYVVSEQTQLSALAGLELRAGIKNVFDKAPRYSGGFNYDSWSNPQQRAFYLSLKKNVW